MVDEVDDFLDRDKLVFNICSNKNNSFKNQILEFYFAVKETNKAKQNKQARKSNDLNFFFLNINNIIRSPEPSTKRAKNALTF